MIRPDRDTGDGMRILLVAMAVRESGTCDSCTLSPDTLAVKVRSGFTKGSELLPRSLGIIENKTLPVSPAAIEARAGVVCGFQTTSSVVER